MAGHSKWHNIKHRKAAVDKKRGKVWTKCAKAIIVAAKNGGPDPDSNLTLRYAIDEARYANMPRDTIERAVKKGAGLGDTDHFEHMRYEGYGPGGVAFIVDALTDNRTRTSAEVRSTFASYSGNLGSTGSVGYLFDSRGRIDIAALGASEDKVIECALDAGAADVESPSLPLDDDSVITVVTDPSMFLRVREAIDKHGFAIKSGEIGMIPQNRVIVTGDHAKDNMDLFEALDDLDDVQKVYTNFDLTDEDAAKISARA